MNFSQKQLEFSQKQLEDGFKLVQSKIHWKDRIQTDCEESEIPLIQQAIIHFTGTVPTFRKWYTIKNKFYKRYKKDDVIYLVSADGYQAGPCGDY
jgi:hypothetical protein